MAHSKKKSLKKKRNSRGKIIKESQGKIENKGNGCMILSN